MEVIGKIYKNFEGSLIITPKQVYNFFFILNNFI